MSTDAKKETKKRTQAKKDLDEIILKIRHGESLTANLKKIKDAIDTLKRFRLKEEGTTELTIKDKKFHGAKFEFTTSKSSTISNAVSALLTTLEAKIPDLEEEIKAFTI